MAQSCNFIRSSASRTKMNVFTFTLPLNCCNCSTYRRGEGHQQHKKHIPLQDLILAVQNEQVPLPFIKRNFGLSTNKKKTNRNTHCSKSTFLVLFWVQIWIFGIKKPTKTTFRATYFLQNRVGCNLQIFIKIRNLFLGQKLDF